MSATSQPDGGGRGLPPAPVERIRILYIGGWGRSGSTLLDRMVGQVPGFVSVGELRDIWQRGWVENRLCGCGAPFHDCPFWTKVGQEAFGGWEQADPEEMARLRYAVDRPWHLPYLLRPSLSAGYRRRARRYVDGLDRLYRAILSVSGAQVLIDSSKIPTYALLLRQLESVDLRILHLVRDSRGVVFSWQKQVQRPDASAEPDFMLRYGVAGASVRYLVYNGLTRALRRLGLPYLLLRYEDAVRDPRAALVAAVEHSGVPLPDDLPHLGDGEVALGVGHTVDGNPMRFDTGTVVLRVDEAWRDGLSDKHTAAVTAITYPLLRRYGYRRTGQAS
ncbi:MAG: sulfotransferase [Euzebyaceae bacterium]|nr:sulfotransferase [Euzebyaceae bacterium]